MKNSLILFAASLLVLSCTQSPEGLEAKRTALLEKQKQLSELETEVHLLEEEIAALDTSNSEIATRVQVKKVETESFEHFVKLTGTVTSQENIMISAETNGRVRSVPAVEGQKVAAGTILVRLEDDIISNQLEEAKSAYELAKLTFEKRKNLWDQNIGSEMEYLQAKNQFEATKSKYAQVQNQYDHTTIKAPIRGSVDHIGVREGEFVSVGTPIARVVDLEKVEIEAELSEQYLRAIKKGDSVVVEIPALDIKLKAPVSFVSQVINPDNRSFKVKVNLDNKKGIIKPNVLANMMIRDYKNDSALVIPSNCISSDLKGEYVYLMVGTGAEAKAEKRYVKKGKSFGSYTEILSGLKPNENVVTVGYSQLNDGEKITIK